MEFRDFLGIKCLAENLSYDDISEKLQLVNLNI